MISQFAPRAEYIGNGSLAAYSFDFKLGSLDDLIVQVYSDSFVKTFRVDGNDTTYLSSVEFDPVDGGGLVTLASNLPSGHFLAILLANDAPTQDSEFSNKGTFTLKRIENAFDYVVGAIQRLAYLGSRSIRLSDVLSSSETFDTSLPISSTNTVIQNNAGKILAIGADNKSFQLGPTVDSIVTNVAVAAAAAVDSSADAAAAASSAANAAISASAAAASAASALASKNNASTSEINAGVSAAAALVSQNAAAVSAANASTSAAAALVSQNAAASSATSASADAATATAAAATATADAASALSSKNAAAISATSASTDAATITALLATVSTLSLVSKYVLSYTDFSAAATTFQKLFHNLITKGYIEWVLVRHSTAFTGGLVSACTLKIGLVADAEYYQDAFDVFQAPNVTLFKKTSHGGDVQSFGGAVGIYATADSVGANLNQLTAGDVEIYIKEGLLP
jgi:hypothetical protein